MSVAGIALDAASQKPVVLLQDSSGLRQVPIWIDHGQAHCIISGVQEPLSKRPLPHDLMLSIMKEGKVKLKRVIINAIEKRTFQAILQISIKEEEDTKTEIRSEKIKELEARPSDAIALAVRTKCSIWMIEEVVAEASIPVDANADAEDQAEFNKFIEEISPSELIQHIKNENKKGNFYQTKSHEDESKQ
tara:strand:+ start:580 stop:1149 length:570 start_codon:yes stop_codon:yes gene_type:complete